MSKTLCSKCGHDLRTDHETHFEDGITGEGLYGFFYGPSYKSKDKDKWLIITTATHVVIHKDTPAAILAESITPEINGKIIIIVDSSAQIQEVLRQIQKQTGEKRRMPPWIAKIMGCNG